MESKLIPSAVVREICGGISDMSLWRWLNNHDLAFPRPVVIQRRRYWWKSDVEAWIKSRSLSSDGKLSAGAQHE
jgi:predicted DNA-binding transcriptional regulator AlpA